MSGMGKFGVGCNTVAPFYSPEEKGKGLATRAQDHWDL